MFEEVIPRIIYTLKRQYGVTVVFTKTTAASYNYDTGSRSVTDTNYSVTRAVVFNIHLASVYLQNTPFVSALKNLGPKDVTDAVCILDASDISVVPTTDMYLTTDGVKYQILAVDTIYRRVYVIKLKALNNDN